MTPVFVYFKEAILDDDNRFTLDFSDVINVYQILFSPKNDYYVTSMNCDLNLLRDFNTHEDILNDIKELSEKSRVLLEKGPAYQNEIHDVYLFLGVGGTVMKQLTFCFWLPNAQIYKFCYNYKFDDVKEQRVRDCRIYSPYRQFIERDLKFKLSDEIYSVSLGEYSDTIVLKFDY